MLLIFSYSARSNSTGFGFVKLEVAIMSEKPSYEELEQRAQLFEKGAAKFDLDNTAPRKSEERFRMFLNNLSDIAYETDSSGNVTYANKISEAITGEPLKDIIGYPFLPLFVKESQKTALGVYQETLNGKSMECELTFTSGRICHFKSKPLKNQNDEIIGAFGIGRDITERKKAEKALEESEAALKSIFRAAPTGIGMVCDRIIKQANERFCEIVGYSQAELLGKNARMLYTSDEDFEYVGKEKYAQINKRGIGTVETQLQRKDGKVIDVLLSSTAIDPNDWSAGITFTVLDITERKQAEEALKQAHDELERRVQERTAELAKINGQLKQEIEMHKRTAEALLKSEAKYRDLFNNAQVGLFQSRVKDGKILECNDKFAQIVGYETREECCADFITAEHYANPGDRERVLTIIRETGKIENHEIYGKRRDGSRAWVRFSGVLNREEDFLEGVMVDITKEKQAEDALRESEVLYKSLFIETRAVMLLVDPASGDIIDANPAACSYYGYSKEEITRKKVFDINTLPQKQMFDAIEKAVSEKQRHFTFRHHLANGDIRDVEVYTNPIKIKGKPLLFSIINDITERKQAEKALRESEMRFSVLSEATWEAIVIHDQGVLLQANDQYYQTFGYEPSELLGKEAISMTATPESVKTIMKHIDSDDVGPYEVVGLRKDGTAFPMEIRSKRIKYSGKEARVGAIRDITERKQAEKELRKREAELEIQSQHLQEVNSALKVLLKQREADKKELQENIVANVKELVLPYLDKLERSKLDDRQKSYINVAQTNLNDIISPFLGSLPAKYLKLTPMEVQVANLIKHGKTTKEIAELLNLSVETIRFHRKNIRKKFGISNKKANLRTYLLSAQ
jgi:PAS domain S-box-containing protein